jgi:hypothetical protein
LKEDLVSFIPQQDEKSHRRQTAEGKRVIEHLAQELKKSMDIEIRQVLEEAAIDVRAILENRCRGWAAIVEEDLAGK